MNRADEVTVLCAILAVAFIAFVFLALQIPVEPLLALPLRLFQ